MPPRIDIQSVVMAAKGGDHAQFEKLYQHLVDKVFSFVCVRTSNRANAEEVTQDIFVEIYKSLPSFSYQSDPGFYAFVYTIARRQLAQHYEKTRRHETIELEESSVSGGGLTADVSTEVTRALSVLDDCSREIVELHHWSRFTFAEIAAMIDMTESAVRVRHHRAQKELAKVLTR